jgi:hypothetical protein
MACWPTCEKSALLRFFPLASAGGLGNFSGMRNHGSIIGAFSSLVIAASAVFPAHAQLPTLEREPWLGYFAGQRSKNFQFGVTSQGEIQIRLLDRSGSPIGHRPYEIVPIIVETLPNGTPAFRDHEPESLETTDPTTDKLEKTTFRAKTKSGIPFEVTVEESRGSFLLGGRVTDPAAAKNPLAFSFVIRMPDLYGNEVKKIEETENERDKKKLLRAFEKKTNGDRASWKWTDGTKMRQSLNDKIEISSKEINGPGITEFEIEALAFQDHKFQFTAAPNSSMKLMGRTPEATALNSGFTILWSQDSAKDPKSEARLAVSVR